MRRFEEGSKQSLEKWRTRKRKLWRFGHISRSSDLAKSILHGAVKGKERNIYRRRGGKTILKKLGQMKTDKVERYCCNVICAWTISQGYGIKYNWIEWWQTLCGTDIFHIMYWFMSEELFKLRDNAQPWIPDCHVNALYMCLLSMRYGFVVTYFNYAMTNLIYAHWKKSQTISDYLKHFELW